MARFQTLAAALAGTACIVAFATPAEAQQKQYNVPAGPLKDALDAFVTQSGMQLIYQADDLTSAKSSGVTGAHSAEDALKSVLQGSGFASVRDGSGARAIVRSAVGNVSAGTDAKNPTSSLGDEGSNSHSDIVVTGTRIRGISPVGSYVHSYDRKRIDESGALTTEEFARTVVENFSSIDSTGFNSTAQQYSNLTGFSQSSSNNFGGAAFNLNGVGPGATLTLLNGHRIALAGGDASFVDISQFPLGAIDHIDFLTDGASAIYGADAVAGVVNIVTRRDFSGGESSLHLSYPTDGGGSAIDVAQSLGASWAGGGILGSFDHYHQRALDAAQRAYIPDQGALQDLLPRTNKNSLIVTGNQELGSGFSLDADVAYTDRQTDGRQSLVATGITALYGNSIRTKFLNSSVKLEHKFAGSWRADLEGTFSTADQRNQSSTDFTFSGIESSDLSQTKVKTRLADVESVATGGLLQLPGGLVRMALSGGYRSEQFRYQQKSFTSGISNSAADQRSIFYAAAELNVPLVGERNTQWWAQRLEVSAAARIDHYSDFGTAVSPKLGLSWKPTNEVSLRASYGHAFKAPLLSQIGVPQMAYTAPTPDPESVGGLADVAYLSGGNSELRPERSTSYSLGADWKPLAVPGLTLDVGYFRVRYRDRISVPPASFTVPLLQDPVVAPYLNSSPTIDQINSIFAIPGFMDYYGGGPSSVVAIFDGRYANIAASKVSVLALNSSYDRRVGDASVHFDFTARRQFQNTFKPSSASPSLELLNTIGQPPKWRARASASISVSHFVGSISADYVGGYPNVYTSPPERIASSTVGNLYLSYTFDRQSSVALKGLSVSLAVNNFTNMRPPLVRLPESLFSAGQAQLNYDPQNANPLGRVVAISIKKAF